MYRLNIHTRQVLEHRHAFWCPTKVVFLNLKTGSNSVYREVLWQYLSMEGLPCIGSLYWNTTGRVIAYGKISVSTEGRVYYTSVLFVLHYKYEIWPLRIEDIHRLPVFGHRCLGSITRVFRDHYIINAWVRNGVLGKDRKSIDEVVNLPQRKWSGHVSSTTIVPRRVVFSDARAR